MRYPLVVLSTLLPWIAPQRLLPLSSPEPYEVASSELFPSREDVNHPSFYAIPASQYAVSYVGISPNAMGETLSGLAPKGLLASSVCSYQSDKDIFYVINADQRSGRHEVALNLTMDKLQEMMRIRTAARIEPTSICARGAFFDVVWRHSSDYVRHFIVHAGLLDEILTAVEEKGQQGYYPAIVQAYPLGSQVHAVVIWRKGFGVKYQVDMGNRSRVSRSVIQFSGKMQADEGENKLRIRSIAPLPSRNVLVIRRDDGFSWRGREIPRNSLNKSVDLTVVDNEIESEMRLQEIPAISMAIRYEEMPLIATAYGLADIRNETKAEPSNRLRVASISKTITAMLIMRLLNQRTISLNDRVFGTNGLLGPLFGPTNHAFLRSITVLHLLEHRSGGWGHAMKLEFRKTELKQREFLAWVLLEFPPRFPPGRFFAYSNIGYLFLGHVIEIASGMSYAQFAQEALFHPLGLVDVVLARTERKPDEVSYYSHDNANPYLSWDPERLDAAAGWTLRADDVARIFGHLCYHLLTDYKLMAVRGWSRSSYGKGIQFGPEGSLFHLGSMAGSEGIGYCRKRFSIAIIANVRDINENVLTPWMESLARRIALRFDR